MAVSSREGLKQYCLRALGAPVVEINVDEDQLEDRIDEALEYWNLYHYEGVEQIYMKQKVLLLVQVPKFVVSLHVSLQVHCY